MAPEHVGDSTRQPSDPLLERLRGATSGSYEVAAELGRGGMAVVYVGTDRQLQRRVAIKVMDPRLSMTQGMAARFLQEARIAARLQHPNIIVVHDIRQSDEIIFFVMSLIDGVAVDEVCKKTQPIPIDQIRWILLQATRALAYAHSEGIVHRDIKPANILLNLKGDVILTDFGIAKALGDTGLTQTGTQVGTPMYMSPEQFTGMPVGPASDQYALGVTAYEMLAGRAPFTGDLYQLISAHGGKTPVPVRDLRPDCPAFLANAVMRMLEKNPEDRWPSLEDLQDVFGANMAMDGGIARRKLAETVRALHGSGGGSAASSGDLARSSQPSADKAADSLVVTISPPGATVFVSGSLELRTSVSMDTGQSLPGAGVRWSSNDESILTVMANGTVTGVSPGTAVVRAVVNGGWAEATIRVEAAPIARLSLTTPHVTMRVGDTLRPEVLAVDVNGASRDDIAMVWISRSPAIADLDAPGCIRAISPGMAVIDVAAGNVRRSLDVAVLRRPVARLQMAAPARSLQLGDNASLTFEAFDDLGIRVDAIPARWTSSAPSVIHVDSTGRALAIGPGVARISASVDEAADSIELESLEPPIGSIQLTIAEATIELGDSVTWSLRVKDINGASRSTAGVRLWTNAPDILLLDESGQQALALRMGEAFIYAAPEGREQDTGATMSVRVVVTDIVVARIELFPTALDIEVGSVAAVNLQGFDRRGRPMMSISPTWEIDATDVAVVEGNGIIRALALGACTIRARVTNADASVVESLVAVRVRRTSIARLAITSERSMLEVGETVALRVATFDAMDVEVSDAVPVWRSTQPAVARVEGNGQLFALAPGRVTITAELEGKSGQIQILVAPSAIESLSITPPNDVIVGVPIRLRVEAKDRNGRNVEPSVQWQVEPERAATLTADGELTPTHAGTMTVRASLKVPTDSTGILSARNLLVATISITARAHRVVSLACSTSALKLTVGRTTRADVRATMEGGSLAPASALTWVSKNPEIVQVSATGELKALVIGETQITVSADELHSSMTVSVVASSLTGSMSRPLAMAGVAVVVAVVAWAAWPSGTTTKPSTVAIPVESRPDSVTTTVPAPVEVPDSLAGVQSERSAAPRVAKGTEPANVPVRPTATAKPPVTVATSVKPVPTQSNVPPTKSPELARPSAGVTAAPIKTTPPAAVDSPMVKVPVTPPVSSPVSVPATPPVTAPAPAVAASATPAVETPNAADLRAIADRIALDVRSGKLRSTADLQQFFANGAEHKVAVGTSPAANSAELGRIQTQFELALSRFNAGGILERRITVVRIEVAKRRGVPELVSATFGPIVKPGSR